MEALDAGLRGKLRVTLVAAPAGFGKTTLLSAWLAPRAGAVALAWVALDAGDNDPPLFWSYVLAALHSAAPRTRARRWAWQAATAWAGCC